MTQAEIGVIGLAVMGQNLILNMDDHGITVAAYNRSKDKVDTFVAGPAKGRKIIGVHTLSELVKVLKVPRRIMLMVRAGEAVDNLIAQLIPLLDAGDILIDGGNANFTDSERRSEMLGRRGLHFIGAGVSGGEEGARHGPSIMPGGSLSAWPEVRPIFQAIAAKTSSGEPCCNWVGKGGAGHFVKMVHNGIEYADMQLIGECYDFMRTLLGMNAREMSAVFRAWNETMLESYLIEITADILSCHDTQGRYLVDAILDAAAQKGTGKWVSITALEYGIPLPLISESVFARCLSAWQIERREAALLYPRETVCLAEKKKWLEALRQTLLAAKIISYAQGFLLMREVSKSYGWEIDMANVAKLWRGGCIIRSAFLDDIHGAFRKAPDLSCLGMDDYFRGILQETLPAWRKVVAKAVETALPVPGLGSGLAFLDGYTSARLPANLIQAQRDYFGAHTYERVDRPRGEKFHSNWTGKGGAVSSSSYEV